ncbi:MAG: hypothetical protein IJD14_06555 [Christensenellaceae bacterium]|nr:hypothetical protein [Christensenellaceae bacterium]
MFKALLKKQFAEIFIRMFTRPSGKKKRSKGTAIAFAALMIYAFGAICFMFVMLSIALSQLCTMDYAWLYFSIFGIIATVLGIIGSVFTTYTGLYQAKDNELLLSMPIKPSIILLMRMITLYAVTWFFEALVLIPATVVYTVLGFGGVTSVIFSIIMIFVLPFFALAVSCILGWLIALAAGKIKNKSFVTVALSLAFIAAYWFVYTKALSSFSTFFLYTDKIGGVVKGYIYPFYQMGLAMQGKIIPLLIFTAMTAALFLVVYYLLSVSFLKLITTKKGFSAPKYREKKMKHSSVSYALLRRELVRFVGNPTYLLNCGLGTLIVLALTVFAVIKADYINSFIPMLALIPFDIVGMLPLLLAGALSSMSGLAVSTAPSVSLEGNTLWLIRSMPTSSWQILKAKLDMHTVISTLPTVISVVIIGIVLRLSAFGIIFASLFSIVYLTLCGAVGLLMNLKFTDLNWTNQAVPVKQGISVLFTMLIGFATLIAYGVGYYLLYRFFSLSADAYLALISAVTAILCVVLIKALKTKGVKAFEEL